MATTRFRVPEINSLMPSVEVRNSDQAFVLDGRNFLFDSKGPKSGFSSRILTPFPFSQPADIQGKRLKGRTIVFTRDSILNWRTTTPVMWDLMYAFSNVIPNSQRTPWQAIYLNGFFYFSQEYRGFFAAQAVDNTQRLWIHRKTNTDIPGLIDGILGMEVVRGRAILVNETTIQWSGLSDLSTLAPTLGGAGIQLISNFVKGTFLALTSFQDGFVVWTTEGAILAEFVGGDSVWRFSAYQSQERPYSLWSTAGLINGGSVFLSRRGLKITNATEAPKDWTPDFNEFLRDYLDDKAENLRKWRLEYDQSTETIYLSESTNLDSYWRTFVLSPTLNKWGVFSDTSYGFLPLTQELYGYVDVDGVANYFDKNFINREGPPDNALGLSRVYPRLEKQHNVLSSSMVSRAIKPNLTVPATTFEVPRGGWYFPSIMETPQRNGLKGLDAWVDIGYLRPAELSGAADALVEFQQLVIGSYVSAAPATMDYTTEWNQDFFYAEVEDYNSPAIITHGDQIVDKMLLNGTIDKMALPSINNLDYMALDFPTVTFAVESVEDYMLGPDTVEDYDGVTLGLPEITYGIKMLTSTDGITVAEHIPELAKFDTGARTWGVVTSGNLHILRLSATDVWQAFHVKSLEATVTYNGGRLG